MIHGTANPSEREKRRSLEKRENVGIRLKEGPISAESNPVYRWVPITSSRSDFSGLFKKKKKNFNNGEKGGI